MSKVTKNERISTLEKQLSVMQTQISSLIECAHSHTERLIALEPDNPFHGKFYKPERDTAKELTGSDLARAMLARGDRWILCGNTTDGFASPCIIDGYRCSEDDLGFVLTNGKSIEPRYIHPVNNQGEPLTAAEVGL